MSNIYVGQSALEIRLTCGQDITGALALKIAYKKPDGTTGTFTASEYTASTGVINYELTAASELDTPGLWTFWSYVQFSDGREATGDVVKQRVTSVGNSV